MDRATELVPLRYVAIGGRGPEDVVADARGRVLTGVEDGRILRVDGLTEPGAALLEGLQFANGLALSADESFLVVAETGARRLTRCWLTGPTAGRAEPFAENLPGMPDNIWRAAPDGPIWVSLAGPRVPPLDLLHR